MANKEVAERWSDIEREMGGLNVSCLTLVAFVIAGVLISGKRVSAEGCQGDLQGLIVECKNFVQKAGPKTPPSQGCCSMLRKADIPCVCKYVTKEIEEQISMEKVVYIARYCGETVHSGMKCGSFTVPVA